MKLLDRKRQTEPSKELPDVLKLLEAARHTLAEKENAEKEAKRERDESQDIAEDAFFGNVPPDEALRKRAFVERGVVEAEREREHAEAVVKAGEAHALRLVDAVHDARNAARQRKIEADEQVIGAARAAIAAAEARLQRHGEEAFSEERSRLDARRFVQAKSPNDWEAKDAEQVRRWLQGVRHQAAGVDPLPERLRPAGEQRLRALASSGVSREYLQTVADRSGYVLMPSPGDQPTRVCPSSINPLADVAP